MVIGRVSMVLEGHGFGRALLCDDIVVLFL